MLQTLFARKGKKVDEINCKYFLKILSMKALNKKNLDTLVGLWGIAVI